jgi:RNase P/RNase MRP subunit p30
MALVEELFANEYEVVTRLTKMLSHVESLSPGSNRATALSQKIKAILAEAGEIPMPSMLLAEIDRLHTEARIERSKRLAILIYVREVIASEGQDRSAWKQLEQAVAQAETPNG